MTAEFEFSESERETFNAREALLRLSAKDGTDRYLTPLQKDIRQLYIADNLSQRLRKRLAKVKPSRFQAEEARLFANLEALHDNSPAINPLRTRRQRGATRKSAQNQV